MHLLVIRLRGVVLRHHRDGRREHHRLHQVLVVLETLEAAHTSLLLLLHVLQLFTLLVRHYLLGILFSFCHNGLHALGGGRRVHIVLLRHRELSLFWSSHIAMHGTVLIKCFILVLLALSILFHKRLRILIHLPYNLIELSVVRVLLLLFRLFGLGLSILIVSRASDRGLFLFQITAYTAIFKFLQLLRWHNSSSISFGVRFLINLTLLSYLLLRLILSLIILFRDFLRSLFTINFLIFLRLLFGRVLGLLLFGLCLLNQMTILIQPCLLVGFFLYLF